MDPFEDQIGVPTVEPWRIRWDKKHIDRFWDWMASGRSGREEAYFSEQVGDSLLDVVARHVPLKGTALDLGAARGFLVNKLLARGLSVIAVDSSPGSVESINAMCAGNERFLGARLGGVESIPAPDGSIDIVFLLEVIEHLGDEVIASLYPELRRVLKPAGVVVVTTPNDERLSDLETICPNCGCHYHVMQHVRSWSTASLVQAMDAAGFEKVVARGTLFSRFGSRAVGWLQLLNARLLGRTPPHLLYIGKRR